MGMFAGGNVDRHLHPVGRPRPLVVPPCYFPFVRTRHAAGLTCVCTTLTWQPLLVGRLADLSTYSCINDINDTLEAGQGKALRSRLSRLDVDRANFLGDCGLSRTEN